MPNPALAQVSDRFIWSAIVVYALAMLAFAAEWAFAARPAAPSVPARTAVPVLIGATGPAHSAAPPVTPLPPPVTRADRPGTAERLNRVGLALTWLAFGLHLAGVLTRGLAVRRVPWGNMYEFSTASAVAATGVFLALTLRQDVRRLGLFVVTPVLLTLGLAATVLYTDAEQLQPALQSVWLVIHVIAAVTSAGGFTVGAAISGVYLRQQRAERREGHHRTGRLPDAAALDALAYRVHAFVFPLWTFAVIAGAIWAEHAWGRYWGWDPKETWAFITWVVYAAYLHARATAGWKGSRAAVIALVGFGALMFNYFVINMVITGLHSYAGT